MRINNKNNSSFKSTFANKDQTKSKVTGKWDRIIIVILSIVIAVSLLCVAGVFLLNSSFLSDKEGGGAQNQGGKIDADIVTPSDLKSKTTNFLICGIDYFEGSDRGKLTDVIMVACFDIEKKNIQILQIPRDTYIGEDYPTGKINAIYGQSTNGGIDGLSKRISKTLKIPIDHYVTVNMDSFIKVVDQIGGVEVDVPKRIDLEGVTLNAGLQTLDGKQAEIFVRERKSYSNGDLGRMEMQKVFMKALVKKVFSLGNSKMVSLATSLINEVTTDLTLAQMLEFYQSFTKVDKENGVNFHVLPTTSAKYGKLFVFSIMKYPAADMLNTFFRPYTDDILAEDLNVFELKTDYEYTPPVDGIYKEE